MQTDPELRNPEEAFQLASRAVELTPKNWAIIDTLAVAAHACGKWEESLRARKEMLVLKTARTVDLLHMAIAHANLGDEKKARDFYDQASSKTKRPNEIALGTNWSNC